MSPRSQVLAFLGSRRRLDGIQAWLVPRKPGGLRARVIGHDRLIAVVASGHPWERRRRGIGAAELARTPPVSREGGSGTRDTLAAALAAALGPGAAQAHPALSVSTTAAVRSAVLAGAAPAVI